MDAKVPEMERKTTTMTIVLCRLRLKLPTRLHRCFFRRSFLVRPLNNAAPEAGGHSVPEALESWCAAQRAPQS